MKRKYKLQYYQSDDALWYWRLLSSNGKIVADGSEGYANKANLLRAVKKLKVFNFDYILVVGIPEKQDELELD
tara:strand:+ start:9036 stop:9254 length:219 start_codon:yes stop_codon:yes gene_type:complete